MSSNATRVEHMSICSNLPITLKFLRYFESSTC